MSPDDLTDYGQAKACPFFVFAAGEIGLVEALPYLVLVFLGNADAAVLDTDEDFAFLFSGLDLGLRVVVAEFDGIVDEVVEDLRDLVHVGMNVEDIA